MLWWCLCYAAWIQRSFFREKAILSCCITLVHNIRDMSEKCHTRIAQEIFVVIGGGMHSLFAHKIIVDVFQVGSDIKQQKETFSTCAWMLNIVWKHSTTYIHKNFSTTYKYFFYCSSIWFKHIYSTRHSKAYCNQ